MLPSIRKTGNFPGPFAGSIKLLSETDLHYKVADCIRAQIPEFHVILGRGEIQTTTHQWSDGWKKGCVGGQPDLFMLKRTTQYD